MKQPDLIDPRDEKWFRLGDVSLCETCGRAIQLRRELWWRGQYVWRWVHFRPGGVSHYTEPAVSWAEAAHIRDLREGVLRD